MIRRIPVLLSLAILPVVAFGQSVTPPISEGKFSGRTAKYKNSLMVSNAGNIVPIATTFEVSGFRVKPDGALERTPLDPGVKVSLSSSSLRIGAGQQMSIDITAECPTCGGKSYWFVVWSTTFIGHTTTGAAIGTRISSVHYVCKREKNCRQSIRDNVFHVEEFAKK